MRIWKIGTVGLLILAAGAGGYWMGALSVKDRLTPFSTDRRQMDNYSDQPSNGLAYDWVDCLEHFVPDASQDSAKIFCIDWTKRGVTSTLYALRVEGDLIPVVESRADSAPETGQVMIEVVGGTGGVPFHVTEVVPNWMEQKFGEANARAIRAGEAEEIAHYQALKRGITVASVGYWGTHIRTLNEPDEIERAGADVRRVVDYYLEAQKREPALLTISLGNHVALAGLGQDRLEKMNVLSLVPVMDGLQNHLKRAFERAEKQNARGENSDSWSTFNVYKMAKQGPEFEFSDFIPIEDHLPKFTGEVDLPWADVSPKSPCFETVLGAKDYRTREYLRETSQWPEHVTVLLADHNIQRDAPVTTSRIMADFTECVLASPGA